MTRTCLVALAIPALACSSARLTSSQAATACVVLQSCFPKEFDGGYFGATLADCASGVTVLPPSPGTLIGTEPVTTGMEGPFGDIYLCLAKASGCSAAANCFGRAGQTGSCSPAGGLFDAGCAGTVLTGCLADGVAFDVDCATYKESCHLDFPQNDQTLAMCDLGACPAAPGCQGSQGQVCLGPGYVLDDCAREGLSCDGQAGSVSCFDEGSDCTGAGATCSGNTVVSCAGAAVLQQDCSQDPTFKRCSNGACVETGTQCTVATDVASCDGTKVKLCQDGTFVEVDCAPLGFSGCAGGVCGS